MRPDPDQAPAEGRLPRRRTDRVEDVIACVLAAVALLLIVVGTVIGLGMYGREAERSELQRTWSAASSPRSVCCARVAPCSSRPGWGAPRDQPFGPGRACSPRRRTAVVDAQAR